jgi:hypothetical protein
MHNDKFNSPIQPSVGDYGLFDVLNAPKEAKVGICALTRKRKPPSCVGRLPLQATTPHLQTTTTSTLNHA